jgi:signal peptidase
MPQRIHPCDDLLRRHESLVETYERLGQALARAAQEVESGSIPDASLLVEVATSREAFTVLLNDALVAADELGASHEQPARITSLNELRSLVRAVADATDRRTALAALERIGLICHADASFEPLYEVQARARLLWQAIQDSAPPQVHSEAAGLADGTHAFAQFLELVEHGEEVTDERWQVLEETTSQYFGRPAAVAAARGRLRVQDAPAPPYAEPPVLAEPVITALEPEALMETVVPAVAPVAPEAIAEAVVAVVEPQVLPEVVAPESAIAQPEPVELPEAAPADQPEAAPAEPAGSLPRLKKQEPRQPKRPRRPRRWLKAGAMTLQAAALLLAMAVTLITVLPALFGARSLVVAGSSMEPTVPRGSVVFVQPMSPTAARVGDIVTFAADGDPNNLVTHRVVQVEQDDQGLALRTEGDANNTEDVWRVRANDTVGKVVMWLPTVGYLVSAASLPAVRIGTLALLLVTLAAQMLRRKTAQPSVAVAPSLS